MAPLARAPVQGARTVPQLRPCGAHTHTHAHACARTHTVIHTRTAACAHRELHAVDGLPARAVTGSEVAALQHEVLQRGQEAGGADCTWGAWARERDARGGAWAGGVGRCCAAARLTLITRWKALSLKPKPFSPVHRALRAGRVHCVAAAAQGRGVPVRRAHHPGGALRTVPAPGGQRLRRTHLKFSAVLGTSLPYRPITILPAGAPPCVMSKNTLRARACMHACVCKRASVHTCHAVCARAATTASTHARTSW